MKIANPSRCRRFRRGPPAALALALLLLSGGAAVAGEADVIKATAAKLGDGNWRFTVTVRHDDTGWKHYADAWQILTPDGTVLGTRTLFHPHETEQPFTRSLSPVKIAAGIRRVRLRARDKVHGFGGREVTVELPK